MSCGLGIRGTVAGKEVVAVLCGWGGTEGYVGISGSITADLKANDARGGRGGNRELKR
jgi:hypothetical protein